MTALPLDNIHNIRLVKQRIYNNLGLLNSALDVVLILTFGVLRHWFAERVVPALNDVDFDAALAAVENTPVALPWRISVCVVCHDRAVLVLDYHREVVLDGDALREAVPVTDVAIFMLRVEVQLLHALIVVKLERKRVVLGIIVVLISLAEVLLAASFSILFAVEAKIAEAVDQLWFGVEPEVHEVEVVD
ncbi:hypothetical protein HG530_002742 [Fusarium avenaceum]|nr:hypothetical protein HG530_002742 [Fusarium avenaceum]